MIQRLIIALWLISSISANAQNYKPVRSDGPDDILEYTPLLATYVIKLSGVDGASSWTRLGVNTAVTLGIAAGSAWTLKSTVHSMRPDGTDNRSFPSGHAVMAFAGATILHKEYGKVSPWISVGGYAVAAFTAFDRVQRNKHHWWDVVAGAGIGIAATELGYWLGDKITGERSRYNIGVSPGGIAFSYRF